MPNQIACEIGNRTMDRGPEKLPIIAHSQCLDKQDASMNVQ